MSLLVLIDSTDGLRSMKHYQNVTAAHWPKTLRNSSLSKERGKETERACDGVTKISKHLGKYSGIFL